MPKTFERPLRATHHCRHYSCERGERLLDGGPRCAVMVDLSRPGATRMCWPNPEVAVPCQLREEYTDAERAAWEQATRESLDRIAAAVGAVPHPIPLRTGGYVGCPNCGGRLRYDRWHRGAEIHCETENCCGARFSIAAGADWPASKKEPAL